AVLLEHPQRRVPVAIRGLVNAVRGEATATTPIDAPAPRRSRRRHAITRTPTPRIHDLEHVATITNRLRIPGTEQPRLIRLRQRIEILVRIGNEPLIRSPRARLRRNVHT